MTYSKETLDATLNTLTEATAIRMIGLAGGTRAFNTLLSGLARNFNTVVSEPTAATIRAASNRWHAAHSSPAVSYHVN